MNAHLSKGRPQRYAGRVLAAWAVAAWVIASHSTAFAEIVDLARFGCARCMPYSLPCTVENVPSSVAIAKVSNPKFKGYQNDICLDEFDQPCDKMSSELLYSFSDVEFLRNDFSASTKTVFSALYHHSREQPQNWDGIYLLPKHSYVILAMSYSLFGGPALMRACDVTPVIPAAKQ
jgi:hypothetical protein